MKSEYCDFVSMIIKKSVEMSAALQANKENSNLDPV